MAFNADMPPELITFDDQTVACEVEIDTFDEDAGEEGYEGVGDVQGDEEGNGQEEEQYVDVQEEPGTSGYDYQYEEVEDPDNVYLFDEDPDQIHQEDQIDVVEYVDEVDDVDPSIPSTSDTQPAASSSSPGPSPAPIIRVSANSERHFTTSLARTTQNPNVYYIRSTKKGGEGGAQMPMYNPISFKTTYTESINRRGKRVMKRTHTPLTTDDMETVLEDNQVMRRMQKEIDQLKTANDEMKKTYEDVQKRHDSLSMVLAEAKRKQKDALEMRRQLQRDIAVARNANTQLSRKVEPDVYQYPRRPNL